MLSRHDEVVITRNSYGAHCLNTPNVLFADIDHDSAPRFRFVASTFALLVIISALICAWFKSGGLILLSALVVMALTYPMARVCYKSTIALRGGPERLAKTRIASFVRRNAAWSLRLYQTPAGLRILVLHRTFKPNEPAVEDFFKAVGADPVYVRMCRNQQCFRARVSPKPWRIGIGHHMRPRPGVWPVRAEHLEKRNVWIHTYEAAATRFASCKFLEVQGQGVVDPQAAAVRDLHDRMSQALSGREIA